MRTFQGKTTPLVQNLKENSTRAALAKTTGEWRRQHVDSFCQTIPGRAPCALSAPGDSSSSPKLLGCSFACAPTLRASGQARRRPGKKETPPLQCAKAVITMWRPPTSHQPAPSGRRQSGSRLSAREALGRSQSEEAGVCGREPWPGKKSDPWAHAHSEGTGRSVSPRGVAEERRARGAAGPAHAP